MIRNVTIQHADDCFKVQVDLDIDANRDYQLFTALGYKISLDEDWRLIDMHLIKAGVQSIAFDSHEQPLEIKINPEYRMPQINLDNNTWIDGNHYLGKIKNINNETGKIQFRLRMLDSHLT